jgi:hypothetical protein
MILFGGEGSGGVVGDVWVLTNANGLGGTPTWIQLAPAGTPPQARVGHTTVYDPASNRLIIFAGESNVALLNDAWVLTHANGVGGVPTWTQITTSGTMPAARADHSAVYDSAKNRMVVFGGVVETLSGPQTINDVFVLTRANNK